ncbi:MAG: DUF998 domain-containing protein [Candidatus Bathyarchaeota archaeon]|nr:DUF998 domain-containing protein [Candidatus Bathyarchaeota archaeon]
MTYSKENITGTLFFVAVTQFLLCVHIAEALYPDYSVSANYISDLGVGPSSIIFNLSVFILGLSVILGAYFLRHDLNFKTMSILLVLMGISAMGVGVFTKDFTLAHGVVSSMTFFFAGISAILSFKVMKKPLSLISIILGIMTLGALSLFSIGMVTSGSMTSNFAYDSSFYLGLGPGGMERMIVYPALIWLAGLGSYIITRQEI